MKKIIVSFILLLFLTTQANVLKGGVTESYIPNGFFGTWGVISKLDYSNKPEIFNFESRDIWTLSGYSNILILENIESRAHSEITIKDKTIDGKTLTFSREKKVEKDGETHLYKETVNIVLWGNNFTGTDEYILEKYKDKKLISKDIGKYNVSGIKISGSNGQNINK